MFRPNPRAHPMEWRNDRADRWTLLAMYDFDVDRAQVAVAAYEAQCAERYEATHRHDGEESDG